MLPLAALALFASLDPPPVPSSAGWWWVVGTVGVACVAAISGIVVAVIQAAGAKRAAEGANAAVNDRPPGDKTLYELVAGVAKDLRTLRDETGQAFARGARRMDDHERRLRRVEGDPPPGPV